MARDQISDFWDHVNGNLIKGQNGHGHDAYYISRRRLRDYWTRERVREVLDSHDAILEYDEQVIRERFLLIFSILVYIGQHQSLGWFVSKSKDDHILPFVQPADRLPPHLLKFSGAQWMFCPLEFTRSTMYRRQLSVDMIIPGVEERIGHRHRGQGGTRITKMRIDPECHDIIPGDGCVVFKIYEGAGVQSLYETETRIYSRLASSSENGITEYYGSFSYEQIEKRIVVMEYADGGSLLDYIQRTRPPVLPEEFEMLWTRLLDLLDGLQKLHNTSSNAGVDSSRIVGVHLDIQPANILVFSRRQSSNPNVSPFDVRFKLADFGISAIRRPSEDFTLHIDDEGNRMYSAAECYPNHAVQDIVKTSVSPSVDIWALGAVFSDVLAWSILGEDGREKYRVKRKDFIAQKLKHLHASGFDCCFHNGTDNRLQVVDDYHKTLLQHARNNDFLSFRMSKVILKYMMTSSRRRLDPMQTKTRALDAIQHATEQPQTEFPPFHGGGLSIDPAVQYNSSAYLNQAQYQEQRRNHHMSLPGTFYPAHQDTQPSSLGRSSTVANPRELVLGHSESERGLCESPAHGSPPSEEEATPEQPLRRERGPSKRFSNNNSPARLIPSSTLTRQTEPRPSSKDAIITSSSPDFVSVERVYEIIRPKGRSRFPWTPSKQPEVMNLPGMREAFSKVLAHEGRDQIFVIDDYSSMKPHMLEVRKTASVVSYVTKRADYNAMDLYFASDSVNKKSCSSSSDVEEAIRNKETVNGACNMKMCLQNIVNAAMQWTIKPTSIYVLTDAIWEPGDPGVDSVIRQCIDKLSRRTLPASTLMFQFIRFGNDKTGRDRLRYLDNDCKLERDLGLYDIVDRKHCRDHVPYIIVGSLSPHNDDKESDEEFQ